MVTTFHLVTILISSVSMALSLAHALELPGKLRLDRETYMAVQTIYYPGFTFGGLVGEIGGMICLAILLYFLPFGTPVALLVLVSLICHVAGHLTYWLMTHPVNGFWLKDNQLGALGAGFFSFWSRDSSADWIGCRNIWEASHVLRAVLFAASFITLITALGW